MLEYFTDIDRVLSHYIGRMYASYLVALLIIISFSLAAKIVNFIFSKVLYKMAVKKSSESDDHVIAVLNAPIFYSLVFFGLYQSITYMKILSPYMLVSSQILKSIMIVIWTSAISKIFHIVIIKISKSRGGSRNELAPILKNISSLVVWFFGGMFIFRVWNLNIMPFLASAGIAGFVVAFAAQDTISHLFSGVSLYFDKPFRVGDRIQLDSGEIGDVLEIGIRSTRIKTLDDTVVVIPNKIVASSRIVNYNKPKSKVKVKIAVILGRQVDIGKVKKAMLDALSAIEEIEKEPAPAVYFTDVTDSGFKFLAIAWVSNPKKQFETKTILIDRIYARMAKDKFAVLSLTEESLKK